MQKCDVCDFEPHPVDPLKAALKSDELVPRIPELDKRHVRYVTALSFHNGKFLLFYSVIYISTSTLSLVNVPKIVFHYFLSMFNKRFKIQFIGLL